MRKLLFLVVLSLPAYLFSGNLILNDKYGNPMDGQTIDLWGDINTSLLKLDFDARNGGSATHVSRMKKIEVYEVPGTFNIFCWDVCYQADSILVSTGTVSLAPNATWLYGAVDYYPQGQVGTTTVRYVIWNISNPNDSSWFIVNYHITGVGFGDHISFLNTKPSYPNPSTGSFCIPIEQLVGSVDLVLTGIDGKTVHACKFVDLSDLLTIPTEEFEPGSYIYAVYFNGKLISAGRQVIIR